MSLRKSFIGAGMAGALLASGAVAYAAGADGPHRPMAGHFDPVAWHKQMCTDHYARNVGRVAYIGAKLSLTDTQRPLFDGWKKTVLDSAKARESDCLARQPKMGEHGNVLERQAQMQQRLRQRLSDLTAEQPSLKALYDALSPEQKQVFDRPGPMGHDGHGPHGHGGWHRHGPQGGNDKA
ncbi:MAG: Spy/CpxP family protein refolding chaperone [Proteobacteria bacterium]|nr:Spy/CpxP family protein refolding chaperone [Pseudomonadota bacterium]